MICGHGGVDCAIWDAWNNFRASDGSEEPTLKSLDVGRIHTHHIGNAAGQNVAEEAETGAQNGVGLKLPGDRRARLKNRERGRRKNVSKADLNRRAERLIYVVRNGIEGASEPGNLIVRI